MHQGRVVGVGTKEKNKFNTGSGLLRRHDLGDEPRRLGRQVLSRRRRRARAARRPADGRHVPTRGEERAHADGVRGAELLGRRAAGPGGGRRRAPGGVRPLQRPELARPRLGRGRDGRRRVHERRLVADDRRRGEPAPVRLALGLLRLGASPLLGRRDARLALGRRNIFRRLVPRRRVRLGVVPAVPSTGEYASRRRREEAWSRRGRADGKTTQRTRAKHQ